MSDFVIDTRGLTRKFGTVTALDRVTFQLHPGKVYGLVGANGQGKTTLIRHVLGLLRAQEGTVRVFGLDPVRHPVKVLQRTGYLSEDRDLPDWMRIGELLSYVAAFYPAWDASYAAELIETFGLDPARKVGTLSKGMRAQVALTAAVAYHPDLVLLDEPSSGLDAVVRRDILKEIIRSVAVDGRTVVFSSHLLDEVEELSDYLLMIDRGRIVLEGSLDEILRHHSLVDIPVRNGSGGIPAGLPADMVLSSEDRGGSVHLVCSGTAAEVAKCIEGRGREVLAARGASLQEVFLSRVGRSPSAPDG